MAGPAHERLRFLAHERLRCRLRSVGLGTRSALSKPLLSSRVAFGAARHSVASRRASRGRGRALALAVATIHAAVKRHAARRSGLAAIAHRPTAKKPTRNGWLRKIFARGCGAQAVSDVSDQPRSAEAQVLSSRGAELRPKFLTGEVLNARDRL